jgi:dihydropteroate synthase
MNFRFKNREIMCRPGALVGIVNVTPDSFSDGGKFVKTESAVQYGLKLLNDGAALLDIGGESTRPGAGIVSAADEINRIVPVIRGIKQISPQCIISIDTRRAETAAAAVDAGADIINDISGLRYSPQIAKIAADSNAGLILMHSRGTPQTMQNQENLRYIDVMQTVISELMQSVDAAVSAGVPSGNIILDPGLGFAKTAEQNIELLARISELQALKFPVLIGHSRKSFIGKVLNLPNPEMRDFGTAGIAAYLVSKRVDFIRVHNVRAMSEVITMFNQCTQPQAEN